MKRKIFIVSEFPSVDNPTYYSWIKTRVEALKDLYDITVIKISVKKKVKNNIIKTTYDGYTLYEISTKKLFIPKIRFLYSEFTVKKILSYFISKEKPDLIHVHFSAYYSWIVKDLAKKFGIPYCITEHATFFEAWMNRFYFGRKAKGAINEANKVFAVSNQLKEQMQKYTSRDIIVKFNIVDTEKFNIQNQERNRDYLYMLSVGSLDLNDKKGYELLLRALAEFKKDNATFRCDIIGDGPNKDKLEKLIDENGLRNNVYLLGSISNDLIVHYYNKIDFFVSSSRVETFGVAILEAMSCGVPILATKSGGPEDFVTSHVGLLVEKESWESLYYGINKMSEIHKQFNRVQIRKYVSRHFSCESYVKRMHKIYEEVIT